jgi:hypothetical protein
LGNSFGPNNKSARMKIATISSGPSVHMKEKPPCPLYPEAG